LYRRFGRPKIGLDNMKKKRSLIYRDCNFYPSALAFAIPAAIFQLL
jgi:hypothetical protein